MANIQYMYFPYAKTCSSTKVSEGRTLLELTKHKQTPLTEAPLNRKRLRLIQILIALFFLGMTATLKAAVYEITNVSYGDAYQNIARIYKVFPLNEPKKASDTRISLVVIDLGGNHSGAPKIALYLSFWRDGEQTNSASSFLIDSVQQLIDFIPLKNKKLQLDLRIQEAIGKTEAKKIEVDYSQFLRHFERQSRNPHQDFDLNWITGSIEIKNL